MAACGCVRLRAAASGAALSQEGPFFGRDHRTKCADTVDCTFLQGGWQGSPGQFDAALGMRVTVTLTGAGADDMTVEAVGITAAAPWVAGAARLAPASTNTGFFTQPPGLGLGATKALSGQGDKSCAAVHCTRITVTSAGAGDDAMEVEAVGDTADQHGDDAEAGARMDCDDDGEEGNGEESNGEEKHTDGVTHEKEWDVTGELLKRIGIAGMINVQIALKAWARRSGLKRSLHFWIQFP